MNKPLSHSLNYSDLYNLCEELCQLKGSYLQEIISESSERYYLRFYKDKTLQRWVVWNLMPSQPFILSVSSTLPRKQKKTTPILNFLNAHFKGLKLQNIEIAEKPNRTIKFSFEQEAYMLFKCFPHGQAWGLFKESKKVISPPQPEEKLKENISFVEPETQKTWLKNEELEAKLGLSLRTPKNLPSASEKNIKKIEKTIEKMQSQKEKFLSDTQAKIDELEKKLLLIETNPDPIYLEIKKLKRRILEYGEKQNEMKRKLIFAQTHPFVKENAKKSSDQFTGTKIYVGPRLEFWVGRNARQNDELLKLAQTHEIWFHMRDYPSAHGILKGPKNMQPTTQQLEFCCQIIAQLSRSQKKPFKQGEKFDFIITPKKFVKKKKGLAPGQVIVERETVRRIAFKEVVFNVI